MSFQDGVHGDDVMPQRKPEVVLHVLLHRVLQRFTGCANGRTHSSHDPPATHTATCNRLSTQAQAAVQPVVPRPTARATSSSTAIGLLPLPPLRPPSDSRQPTPTRLPMPGVWERGSGDKTVVADKRFCRRRRKIFFSGKPFRPHMCSPNPKRSAQCRAHVQPFMVGSPRKCCASR